MEKKNVCYEMWTYIFFVYKPSRIELSLPEFLESKTK